MSLADPVHGNALTMPFLASTTITAAVAATGTTPYLKVDGSRYLVAQAIFTYGSGGTTAKAYVQTSLDNGSTWMDIICFAFTTATLSKVASVTIDATTFAASAYVPIAPTDGSLADNTSVMGILGDRFRVKWVTTGVYAGGTTLKVDGLVKG